MEELLVRLETWLQTNQPYQYALLHPGLSEAEVRAFVGALGVALPPEFYVLYRWRDGLDISAPEPSFMGFFRFSSHEEILVDMQMMKELWRTNEDFAVPGWWHPQWVSFLNNGFGDSICIDMAGSFGGKPGQIIRFIHDSDDRTVLHESLTKWLQTLVLSLEQGIPQFDANWAETDAYKALYASVNPGYPKYHRVYE